MGKDASVFLDTSALFAACWSSEGGARLILKLGEAGALKVLVSPQVLLEAERTLRKKAQDLLPLLAILLDASRVLTVKSAGAKAVRELTKVVGHPGDAQIAADAAASDANYLVTLDRRHLLGNARLASVMPYTVATPGDFIDWFRDELMRENAGG
jgi:predicted nucleic acid-binding protein